MKVKMQLKEEASETPSAPRASTPALHRGKSIEIEKANDGRVPAPSSPRAAADAVVAAAYGEAHLVSEALIIEEAGDDVSDFSDCAGDVTFSDRLEFAYSQLPTPASRAKRGVDEEETQPVDEAPETQPVDEENARQAAARAPHAETDDEIPPAQPSPVLPDERAGSPKDASQDDPKRTSEAARLNDPPTVPAKQLFIRRGRELRSHAEDRIAVQLAIDESAMNARQEAEPPAPKRRRSRSPGFIPVTNSASSATKSRFLREGRGPPLTDEERDRMVALKMHHQEERHLRAAEAQLNEDAAMAAALEREEKETLKGRPSLEYERELERDLKEKQDRDAVTSDSSLPPDLMHMLDSAKAAIQAGNISAGSILHDNDAFKPGNGKFGIVNSKTHRPMRMRFERRWEAARKANKLSAEHIRRYAEDKQNLFQDFADSGGDSFDDLVLYEDRRQVFEESEREEYDLLDRPSLLQRHHGDLEFVNSHIRSCIENQNFVPHPDAPGCAHKTLYVAWRSRVFTKSMLKQRMHSMKCQTRVDKGAMAELTKPGGMFSQTGAMPNATFQVPSGPGKPVITPLMQATQLVAAQQLATQGGGLATPAASSVPGTPQVNFPAALADTSGANSGEMRKKKKRDCRRRNATRRSLRPRLRRMLSTRRSSARERT